MTKTCEFCNLELDVNLKNYKIAKYCSKDCTYKARDLRRNKLPKQSRNCLTCGNLIDTNERRDKVYCSQTCKTKALNKKAHQEILDVEQYKYLITDEVGYTTIKFSGKHNNKEFIVDTKYILLLNAISNNWYLNTNGYVRNPRDVKLHRIIAELQYGKIPKDKVVDHINRNKLDNRESNLRLATLSENSLNKNISLKNSPYKGVYKQDTKYVAIICVKNKNTYLGRFDTPEEAAKAYNEDLLAYNAEFAVLNVIPE